MKQQRQLDQLAFPGMDPVFDSVQQPAAPRAESFLPVPERQLIDIQRVQHIFGTSHAQVLWLIRRKSIAAFQMAGGRKWYIEYDSVVGFCDALRARYFIRDRRPARRGMRWRDEDLLPFPLSDTISFQEAGQRLHLTDRQTMGLIEQGCFEAYHLFDSSPWRISRNSLEQYAQRLQAQFHSAKQEAAAQTRQR